MDTIVNASGDTMELRDASQYLSVRQEAVEDGSTIGRGRTAGIARESATWTLSTEICPTRPGGHRQGG